MPRAAIYRPVKVGNRWKIRWYENGKRMAQSFAKQKDALAFVQRRSVDKDDVRMGLKPANEITSPRFRDYAAEYLETRAKNRNKLSEQVNKEKFIRLYLNPVVGDLRLHEIGPEQVEAVATRMLGRELSKKYVNNALTVLRTLLIYAKRSGRVLNVPAVETLKTDRGAFDFLDFDEYDRLVGAVAGEAELLAMVLAGGDAGVRSGEIRGLYFSDIDFPRRRVTVRRTEYHGTLDLPKGGCARIVDLTTRLVAALQAVRHLKGDIVFSGPAGELLTEKPMSLRLHAACRRAGLRKIGWHALRHTFCSHLAMRGAPARAIMELAGHADLGTTLRYMHLSPASTRQAIDLLEPVGSISGPLLKPA
jgi:integrase